MGDDFIRLPVDGLGKKTRSISKDVSGHNVFTQVVADMFEGGEVLNDQSGANGVLTFTFAGTQHLVWVLSDGATSRLDPFGGTPSSTRGIKCFDQVPQPVTITTTGVKVYAPTGATVTVWGYKYQ